MVRKLLYLKFRSATESEVFVLKKKTNPTPALLVEISADTTKKILSSEVGSTVTLSATIIANKELFSSKYNLINLFSVHL